MIVHNTTCKTKNVNYNTPGTIFQVTGEGSRLSPAVNHVVDTDARHAGRLEMLEPVGAQVHAVSLEVSVETGGDALDAGTALFTGHIGRTRDQVHTFELFLVVTLWKDKYYY